MEGLTLKTWQLQKKIGSGACSDVYTVNSVIPLGTNEPQKSQFVMKISPLPHLSASKQKNKKRKKTMEERNADALYAEHLLYKNYLRDQRGIPYVPLGAYGEDQGYRFLVIERLGRTLETVLQEEGLLPSKTAARLGQEIVGTVAGMMMMMVQCLFLETLEQMHMKNILYVDVKPDNFMLNLGKEENQVYCVDFGISDRYVTAAGKHKDYKEGTVVGTPTFLSVNCHNGVTCSRRDDVESLLYVLIYLMRGDLPWQRVSSDIEGAKIKKTTSVDQLCASLPREWSAMLTKIRACGFEERPDYDFFAQHFSKLGGKKGLTTPFEWGTRKTSNVVAKAVRLQAESSSDNSECKRVKSVDEGIAALPLGITKTKTTVSSTKKKNGKQKNVTLRYSKAPAKRIAAPASDITRKTCKKDENELVEPDNVSPKDREVFKAIASHAAAVKRYNLRSSTRN